MDEDSLFSILIFSYMMRPKNAEDRLPFLYRSIVKYYATQEAKNREQRIVLARDMANLISILGTIGEFSKSFLDPNTEYFDQVYYDCFSKGIVSGHVFLHAISQKISVSQAIHSFVESSEDAGKYNDYMFAGIKVKFAKTNIENNIWPQYKKVAVYWAALVHDKISQNPEHLAFFDFTTYETLPPAPEAKGIQGFSAMVDYFIQKGTTFKAPRASKALLGKDESLPVVELFRRLLLRQI